MAIDIFGFSCNPSTDDGTNTNDPTVWTPPSSMQLGDLVVLHATARTSSLTLAMSETGGQTWHEGTQQNQTFDSSRIFWCVFNGTWTANPSVSFGATNCNTVLGVVWRPNGGTGASWELDQTQYTSNYSAPADPYLVTITSSLSTQTDGALVIAFWSSIDNNTWGSLTGSTHTWTALSQAQFRNSSGSDSSISCAWMIDETHGAVGTVSQNQASLGGDGGTRTVIAFKETVGVITLTVQNASISLGADSPTLGQEHTLTGVANPSISLAATSPTLSQLHTLALQNASIGLTADNITLGQAHTLAIQDVSISLAATTPTLTQAHTLVVQDASIALEATTPTLVQLYTLQVSDAVITTQATTPTLVQTHNLVVQDASISLEAGSPVLSLAIMLVVDNATISLTSTTPTLTQEHTLSVQNVSIALHAASVALEYTAILVVQDASISMTATSPTLRTEYWQKVNVYVRVSI